LLKRGTPVPRFITGNIFSNPSSPKSGKTVKEIGMIIDYSIFLNYDFLIPEDPDDRIFR
jgi:hypothetical protein